jgi:ABC-2 type transport system permease protein
MKRILAIASKEWRLRLRGDVVFLVFIQPLIFCLVWGYCTSLDLRDVKLAILDQSNSYESRRLVRDLQGAGTFTVAAEVENRSELERALTRGDATMGVVVAPTFARDLKRGRARPLEIVADGTDPNIATLGVSYAVSTVQSSLELQRVRGGANAAGAGPSISAWYNPSLRSADIILLGAIAYNLMYFFFYAAQSLVDERRRGTLQVLAASPIRATELWLGLLLTNGMLAMWGTLSQIALMLFVVGVPFRGDAASAFLGMALLTVIHLNIGCLFPLFSKTPAQLTVYGLVFVFLAIAVSGFLLPLSYLPGWTQRLADAIPLKHGLIFVRAEFLKGRRAPRELEAMVAFAIGTSIAALLALRSLLTRSTA